MAQEKEKEKDLHHTVIPSSLGKDTKPEQILKIVHSAEGQLAEKISNWAGSMPFVYFHVVWFTAWILINSTTIFNNIIPVFDPFPYGLLTMVVSLEAIFLATFIMINQNRQALLDTYRDLEEEQEELEEDKEQEELEEDVEEIQTDLDEIKAAITTISKKIENIEKPRTTAEKRSKKVEK